MCFITRHKQITWCWKHLTKWHNNTHGLNKCFEFRYFNNNKEFILNGTRHNKWIQLSSYHNIAQSTLGWNMHIVDQQWTAGAHFWVNVAIRGRDRQVARIIACDTVIRSRICTTAECYIFHHHGSTIGYIVSYFSLSNINTIREMIVCFFAVNSAPPPLCQRLHRRNCVTLATRRELFPKWRHLGTSPLSKSVAYLQSA